MTDQEWLADQFETNRSHLRAVAYRMLGSLSEADDLRGARAVAEGALAFSKLARFARAALVNGAAGILAFDAQGRPFSVMGFTVVRGRIVEIDILADPVRLRQLVPVLPE